MFGILSVSNIQSFQKTNLLLLTKRYTMKRKASSQQSWDFQRQSVYFCVSFQWHFYLFQFSSVAQSCPILCDPMNCSTAGLPVHHQLPEFTQTHVHRASDAIQPYPVVPFSSCLQSLPASESFPMSQFFAWGDQSTRVSALASFLPKNTQDWSLLEWTGWISLQSQRLSRVFSNTTVQKHQFFGAQPSSQSNSHIHTRPQEKP